MKVSAVLVYLKCLLAKGGEEKQGEGRALLAMSGKGWHKKLLKHRSPGFSYRCSVRVRQLKSWHEIQLASAPCVIAKPVNYISEEKVKICVNLSHLSR